MRAQKIPPAGNPTEGRCLKRDSNSYSRNGQGILSPSCLPFHHSGVRWCKGKDFRKGDQMFWLVLHDKNICWIGVGGRITVKCHILLTIRFGHTHSSAIVEVVMSLATSTDKRAWCRRFPRQSTFHISPLVARWANEVESHDRLPSAQVGQGRSAHHKTSNRSGSPISIECRARISARALGSIRENVVRSIIGDSAPLPHSMHSRGEHRNSCHGRKA